MGSDEQRSIAPARQPAMPYVDRLLERLEARDPDYYACFGRHVHWGYWPEPQRAGTSAADFAAAAERLSSEVCAVAGAVDGQRVLDVGCGLGGTLAALDTRRRGMLLAGVNIDARQLRRAQELFRPGTRNSVTLLQADAVALPVAAAAFDVVLAVESIFHFRDRALFLAEAARVLRRGGSLAVTDFVPTRYVHFKSSSFYGPINLRCSVEHYRAMAAAAGLALTAVRDINANTLPTYRVLRRLGHGISARAQTLVLETLSRLGLLRYTILSFRRP